MSWEVVGKYIEKREYKCRKDGAKLDMSEVGEYNALCQKTATHSFPSSSFLQLIYLNNNMWSETL